MLLEDGFSYNRKEITEWLKFNNRSPVTNLELKSRTITTNRTLRSIIEEWKVQEKAESTCHEHDDFRCDGWKDVYKFYPCDWTLALVGSDQSYPVNLDLLSTRSDFFSRLRAPGESSNQPAERNLLLRMGATEMHPLTFRLPILSASDTLQQLKRKIHKETGIAPTRQTLLIPAQHGAAGGSAPAGDYLRPSDLGLADGDALTLAIARPWQHTDRAARRVELALPAPCAAVFEAFLDQLCRRCEGAPRPGAPPRDALALLWLAGHFEARPLKDALLQHLLAAVTPADAHRYLLPAVGLGLESMAALARGRAAGRLDAFPAAELADLPLEEVAAAVRACACACACRCARASMRVCPHARVHAVPQGLVKSQAVARRESAAVISDSRKHVASARAAVRRPLRR